jgi:hypothetical protein
MAIDTIRIFPPIGIARLGNSPDEFFIGPELPGDRSPPSGGYKDSHCRIKRQAARFRLFGYEAGVLKQEITLADADIKWTVELANTKADWKKFGGVENPSLPLRNGTVVNRESLRIKPGPRTLDGPNQKSAFNTGTFLGTSIPLGEIQTDNDGRLLVLGGFGNSASPINSPIVYWAENDGWHDDVSDGPVKASVKLKGTGSWIQASPSWVICGPPKFAPSIDNIITLYDTLFQVAVDKFGIVSPSIPSFTKDIYPLLVRAINMKWVTSDAAGSHSTLEAIIPPPGSSLIRQAIFSRLRDPSLGPHQLGSGDMPKMWSDVFDTANDINQAFTKIQYKILQQWKDGTFVNDWTGPPVPEIHITPEGLTRAALENCVGAAFYPGIETSFMTRDTYTFVEPFRLDSTLLEAGDLTKQMAVPWQTDFYDCSFGDAPLHWWPAARPEDVFPVGGGPQVPWTRDLISGMSDMVQNWHKLGFVVRQGVQYVETERHIICRDCFIITNRSTFSKDQIDSALGGIPGPNFDDSFFIVVEGFKPSDLGIVGSAMTPTQLIPIAPVVTFTKPDNSVTPGMSASPQKVLLEDDFNLDLVQRITFSYRITFINTTAFASETVEETLTASIKGMDCNGFVILTDQPNPYMLDGSVSWLSIDVRVFKLTEGEKLFGLTMGGDAASAVTFIQSLLTNFNGLPAISHPFDTISTDQQISRLELSRSVSGKRVFNFAVAKVRYMGKNLLAKDVRLFFRLFTTAATGLDYNASSTYRIFNDGSKVVPLLGFEGGQVVTIPCFASHRIDPSVVSMSTQLDDSPNKRTLNPSGPNEVQGYFGCWLDINQTELRIPTHSFPGDGPYGVNVKSIQDSIRGFHQCLVAEINFSGQPISLGASPANNDKLSQRNLTIVESDNPGGPDSHTVAHTFEFKPSLINAGEIHDTSVFAASRDRQSPPDEIMICWLNLPRDTEARLYFPTVEINELLKFSARHHELKRLERVDDHTIRCRFGDVTYIPVPAQRGPNIAGLITLLLPDHVNYGQFFRVVVHQISGPQRRIIGSFQISIPIKEASLLLERETRYLSVLRNISLSIPGADRWRPVFDRYLDVIAQRVRGFGGNPDVVQPSADGSSVQNGQTKPGAYETPDTLPSDLFCLNIPWKDCCVDGEFHLNLRVRKK